MENKVNYTIVGLFVIFLLSAIILSIIWLSAGLSIKHYTTYMVNMKESVSGLNVDSPVEYNGVGVGNVASIALDQKDPHIVNILLNIESQTPITQGTRATLNIRGLSGTAYIALQDKGTNTQKLVAGKNEKYPVILTTPSLLMRMDTAISELSTNLHQVSASIESLLAKENQQAIKQTLLNIQTITTTVAASSQELTTLLKNAAKASVQLPVLLQSGLTSAQFIERQLLPTANRAMLNLNNTTDSLFELSTELKQNPSLLIRGRAPEPLGPGEK